MGICREKNWFFGAPQTIWVWGGGVFLKSTHLDNWAVAWVYPKRGEVASPTFDVSSRKRKNEVNFSPSYGVFEKRCNKMHFCSSINKRYVFITFFYDVHLRANRVTSYHHWAHFLQGGLMEVSFKDFFGIFGRAKSLIRISSVFLSDSCSAKNTEEIRKTVARQKKKNTERTLKYARPKTLKKSLRILLCQKYRRNS